MPTIRCCSADANFPLGFSQTHSNSSIGDRTFNAHTDRTVRSNARLGSEVSMCIGGEGSFADDLEVRKSLAAAQLGRKGQPEPHALVGMRASEGAGPSLCLRTLRSSASGQLCALTCHSAADS